MNGIQLLNGLSNSLLLPKSTLDGERLLMDNANLGKVCVCRMK